VIFLRTAALGAEEFYTCDNNQARKETAAQAREMDQRTLETWIGHPHLRVIENGPGGFEEKKRNTLAAVCGVLGIPEPLEIERKFLIKRPNFKNFPVKTVAVPITQYYLKSGSRIRARGRSGRCTYYYTIKKEVRPYVRVELERQITEKEFLSLLNRVDRRFHPVVKIRRCFEWCGQYFELDAISSPKKLYLLERELGSEDERVVLPPFVTVIREVTTEKEYSNQQIARL
jgi:CYTH domain-containing protein